MLGNIIDKRNKYVVCKPVVDEETNSKVLVCSVKIPGSPEEGVESEGVKVAEVIFNLDEKGRPTTVRGISTDGISDTEIVKTLKRYIGNSRW